MHLWDYKIDNNKQLPVQWKLERLINYGLDNEKLDQKELKANLEKLSIDPNKKKFLKLLLWSKKF